MVRLSYGHQLLLALSAALGLALSANAASVTPQVLVNFDGSLSGTAYTLGPGEIDNSGSFAGAGSVVVSGGVADVSGDVDFVSGLYFSGGDLADIQGFGSTLQNVNWISETCVYLDVPVDEQPVFAGKTPFNHVLDIQGDTFFRFTGSGPKITEFGYYSSANDSEPKITIPDPSAGQWHHFAMVWTAETHTMEAFLDDVSQGSVSTGFAFDASSPLVGYGFFARSLLIGANHGRAINGKLDGVAFSTFTGTFDSSSDFQLSCVPEPSSVALLAIALGGLACVRRK